MKITKLLAALTLAASTSLLSNAHAYKIGIAMPDQNEAHWYDRALLFDILPLLKQGDSYRPI